jgi:hypothetical protein
MNTHLETGSFLNTRWWTALAALAALVLTNGCQSPKPVPPASLGEGWLPSQAQVAEAQGAGCQAKAPGGTWRKLKAGDWLAPGTMVEAKAFTRLRLRLYEVGIMVEVKPSSLVCLEKLSYRKEGATVVTSTLLDLQKGELAVDGSSLTPGSEFTIKTPQGVTQIPAPAVK